MQEIVFLEPNKIIIAYESKTGNVDKFVEKLKTNLPGFVFYKITSSNSSDLIASEQCALITFTTGYGNIPQDTIKFINKNHHKLISISSSGNRNWGSNFAIAADKISKVSKIPIGLKFELSGNKKDVDEYVKHIHILKEQS
jgi:protein involved in ribonucleotide reduction